MEEKIVIKSRPGKNKTSIILLLSAAGLFLASLIVASVVYNNNTTSYYIYSGYGRAGIHTTRYYNSMYDSMLEFFFWEFFSCIHGYIILASLVAALAGFVMKSITKDNELVVTVRRVYGHLARRKAVDIPLEQITSVRPSAFHGVSVTHITGTHSFYCLENQKDILTALAQLLAPPQTDASVELSATTDPAIDRLTSLKKLLDSGIITQEEFDAKKKQLLGL